MNSIDSLVKSGNYKRKSYFFLVRKFVARIRSILLKNFQNFENSGAAASPVPLPSPYAYGWKLLLSSLMETKFI
jgi:hypothetical protein